MRDKVGCLLHGGKIAKCNAGGEFFNAQEINIACLNEDLRC